MQASQLWGLTRWFPPRSQELDLCEAGRAEPVSWRIARNTPWGEEEVPEFPAQTMHGWVCVFGYIHVLAVFCSALGQLTQGEGDPG